MTAQVAESSLTIYNYKELLICVDYSILFTTDIACKPYIEAISCKQFIIGTYMYIDIPT